MSDDLDIAGTAEAAEILGVEVPRITRWRIAGRMPKWAVWTAATPVWHSADVRYMRDHRDVAPEDLQFSGPLDLVGIAEVANLLEVNKSQIGRWRRAGRFPAPALDRRSDEEPTGLYAGPVWWRSDILSLQRERAEAKRARGRRKRKAAREAAAKDAK